MGLEYEKWIFCLENGYKRAHTMKRVKNIIEGYDPSDKTDEKKIRLIEWFQKHPGQRFDKAEIQKKVGDELGVKRARTGQILNDLVDESVLEAYGEQRKAYELSDDILVPIKYRSVAGFRHFWSIIDIKRWGISGFLVMITVLWFFLTIPFWFFSVLLLISPTNQIGVLSEYEILVFTIAMSVWLLIFTVVTALTQYIRLWWNT